MNRRNKYFERRPDFESLASKHASLREYLAKVSNPKSLQQAEKQQYQYTIDFRDPDALKELTRVLLLEDYGIHWDIPPGHLIPPVTNRANYVHWVKDLLEYVVGDHSGVKGVDIGVGANCIYTLLGAAVYKWHMTGTDVDFEALKVAEENVARNDHLRHLVKLIHNDNAEKVLCGVIDMQDSPYLLADFVLCNPPFFEHREQQMRNPRTACPATSKELVYRPSKDDHDDERSPQGDGDGGEVAFVKRMIQDSLTLQDRVRIYTTMLGRKASLRPLKEELAKFNIRNLYTTEFVQGRTTRWGLAWTLLDPGRIAVGGDTANKGHRAGKKRQRSTFETNPADSAPSTPVVKQKRIAIGTTLHQTVTTGHLTAKQLFDIIVKETREHSEKYGIESVNKVDSMMCKIGGKLSSTDRNFSITILQLQPRQFTIEYKQFSALMGRGGSGNGSATMSYQLLYENMANLIAAKTTQKR